jgi:hypothetical protein
MSGVQKSDRWPPPESPNRTRRSREPYRYFAEGLVTRHCPSQFVLGIYRGFVIE